MIILVQLPLILLGQAGEPEKQMVQGEALKLYSQTYKSQKMSDQPRLLVVLHGDSPFNNPDYQYRFARHAADTHTNLVAVALLRPGYRDPDGHQSEGKRGRTNGDNWHAGNTDAIAAVITQLAQQYRAAQVVLAGHSGGAALSANILGRHPDLINKALLVSLPSDLDAWRKHMHAKTQAEVFNRPVQSLSALMLLPKVKPTTTIHLIVGEQDDVTPVWLSKRYHEQAIKQGKQAELTIVPEKGHDILLDPAVFEQLAKLLDP